MQFFYDISILPLLNMALILALLTLFSTHLYIKTGIKTDLYLAISFGIIFLLPLTIYTANGEVEFWSRPYHLAGLSSLLTILAVYWLAEKRTLSERLPLIILTAFIALLTLLPSFIGGLAFGLAYLIYSIWLFYRRQQGYDSELIRSLFFMVIAVCVLLGQITQSLAFIFLYSLVLLSLLIYETLRYFDRVVLLVRNAGISSITDNLTGLFNKSYLLKKTAQLVQRKVPISIIFADIDNFKSLNDTKGHEYGDIILREVGGMLKEVLNNKGLSCRFGGEEMVGIVTNGDANKLAEIFRERVEKEIGVTVSVGVAHSNELTQEPLEDLHNRTIKKADFRMYAAKNNGKNRVVLDDSLISKI
ncbi:GGDEF domain-containing protein (plasmid) [Ureibacillus chungkukjangi]|uniref:GGDEF domain-containing protein n=1 Tax=Ureibacillus chungkukjangi TaxID=1202712 RepID=UPI00187D4D88|nr:GGDEF domain-containing protein [Ureibacillus chungkukjangi]MCM3390202.1 GGDEF domain-containing protein [Ureibacillus chungkukjangi]